MTWLVSSTQAAYQGGQESLGQQYWYQGDDGQFSLILPGPAFCNSEGSNPRICLPQSPHVSNYLLEKMNDYKNIKAKINLNGVDVVISSITPAYIWPANSLILSKVS